MEKSWYGFSIGDVTDTSRYYKMSNGIDHCLCGTLICAVYVYGADVHPKAPFTANMQQYIKKAMATGQLQPDMPFDAKKFVYLKY